MIIDNQTNFVYLADTLPGRYPNFYKELVAIFHQYQIAFDVIKNTKDVWAVDYMPIQISERKFVRFTYKPDYLRDTNKWLKTISDVDAICDAMGVKTLKSSIVLDGGNLSKWKNKALLCNKVFLENSDISEMELVEQLKNLLEVNQLIFVPWEKDDWLGHGDGIARFIAEDTVLINDFGAHMSIEYLNLISCLQNAGLKWKIFPCDMYQNQNINNASGLYLNYLELEKHLILPVFNRETDNLAIAKAKSIFKDKEIISINGCEPARDSGIINCLTWNIKK